MIKVIRYRNLTIELIVDEKQNVIKYEIKKEDNSKLYDLGTDSN